MITRQELDRMNSEITITGQRSREFLIGLGFEPADRLKVAGVPQFWAHQDGRKAMVLHSLAGGSAQRAGATGWRFSVRYQPAGQ